MSKYLIIIWALVKTFNCFELISLRLLWKQLENGINILLFEINFTSFALKAIRKRHRHSDNNMDLLSDCDEILYETSSWMLVKNWHKNEYVCKWRHPPSPLSKIHESKLINHDITSEIVFCMICKCIFCHHRRKSTETSTAGQIPAASTNLFKNHLSGVRDGVWTRKYIQSFWTRDVN